MPKTIVRLFRELNSGPEQLMMIRKSLTILRFRTKNTTSAVSRLPWKHCMHFQSSGNYRLPKHKFMKKYLAEIIGTFALVFCGTGAIIINQESHGVITHVGV